MSLDINSLSKNPSLDSRGIYIIELVGIYIFTFIIIIFVVSQSTQLYQTTQPSAAANVQQTQLENALKALGQ